MSHVTAWETFYVIIGSAGASLTGLMFVVVTLIAGRRAQDPGVWAAFKTPTVVHFGTTLLVAAILSAPWQALWQLGLPLGLCGLGGAGYVAVVMRRTRRQTSYTPVLEDWLFNVVLPIASYTALFVAAIVLQGDPTPALFVIGATMVLLLFIGIHNAWDVATYVTITLARPGDNR